MQDEATRLLVALAHCENLWVSRPGEEAYWMIDGPSECVTVAYGSTLNQWRKALLQAAGADR
jgi:hypothetical protein